MVAPLIFLRQCLGQNPSVLWVSNGIALSQRCVILIRHLCPSSTLLVLKREGVYNYEKKIKKEANKQ